MTFLDFLRTFFGLNREIIYFGYGLVFFVVGFAIALQSRSYSRLDLARSLKWLAAFGFAHGIHEWGDLFIPIQSAYLNTASIHLLHYFHLLILAVSFACLFEFGVALLSPLERMSWLRILPSMLFALWVFIVFFPLNRIVPVFTVWTNVSDALARYFIGFPAALVAAYGLRRHTMQRIVPLRVPHIVRMLRFAGIMLAFYAFFAGLIVPPVPFFPGSLLNNKTFEAVFIAPAPVFRSLIGLGLAIAIIRALEVFDVETERMIEAMEQQQILISERNRIARELHDGAIQKVYTAGLLVESAHKLTKRESQAFSRLERAENVLNDAITDLRRNLVELNAAPTEETLGQALSNLVEDPRFRSLLDISLNMDLPETDAFSPIRVNHVLAVVNEALSNAIRHARARRVKVTARKEHDRLKITVQDNGVGLPEEVKAGFGLRNMRDRARLLGGTLDIHTDDGRGTIVELNVPWKEER